jgi:DNA-binding GntR family transcriptional regulator
MEKTKEALLAKVKEAVQNGETPPENSFTASEYAEFAGLSPGSARVHLRRLAKEGKVKLVLTKALKGQKYYTLIENAEREQSFRG